MSPHLTRSGIALKPTYVDPAGRGEAPGDFPFTRGRRPHPNASGGWIQRALSGEGSASHSNAQLQYLIAKGQTGLDVIGDAATAAGLDPDHPLAVPSVGTQGVSLCRKQDILDLLTGIPLDQISFSASLPPQATIAGYTIAAETFGFAQDKLRGSLIQAPLYSEDCCYAVHLPVDYRVRASLDSIEYAALHLPRFHGFIEDTYFFSESGLDPVEEMALGFIEIRYLVRRLLQRGLPIDSFAPRIAILVNCGMDFFEEIAKIRATRRIFAKMMRDEFGAQDPRSLSVVITSHTSGLSMTAQQPVNNIIRGTSQAIALVLAGVQALEISAFDEAFRTPSPESHMVGLRTQQILDLEAGVARVADPFGGSYFIEDLTNEMEQRIVARVAEIEALGDAVELVEQGFFRQVFTDAMERQQKDVAKGDLPIVGVNRHQIPDEEDRMLKEIAEQKFDSFQGYVDEIRGWKAGRDKSQVRAAIDRFKRVVESGENVVPATRDCLENDVTFGEIKCATREVMGLPYDFYGMIDAPAL
jgi:methylmalonyl-CoA mutase N-terminal domain/subunit